MIKKFKIIILLNVVLLLFSMVSCTSENNKNIYVIDSANDETCIPVEKAIWNIASFENTNAPKKFSLRYDGAIYDGEYHRSTENRFLSYAINEYKASNGIEFALKDGTNELVQIGFSDASIHSNDIFIEDLDNAEEYALEYAKTVAKEFINIEEYELSIEEPIVLTQKVDDNIYNMTHYTFNFTRKICDIFTSDYISIKINSKGSLVYISCGDIGAFNSKIITELPMESILQEIKEKVIRVYRANRYKVRSQDVEYQRLCITPDGEVGIYSLVAVLTDSKIDNQPLNTGTALFTYVE